MPPLSQCLTNHYTSSLKMTFLSSPVKIAAVTSKKKVSTFYFYFNFTSLLDFRNWKLCDFFLRRKESDTWMIFTGMRRPSWNKSQAIQQVISLKSLLEPSPSPSNAAVLKSAVVRPPLNSTNTVRILLILSFLHPLFLFFFFLLTSVADEIYVSSVFYYLQQRR